MRFGTSYHGSRRLVHVERDFDTMVAAGASIVVLCLTEEEAAYRPGLVGPIVAAAAARGLEPWLDPWGVLGLFGGEAASWAVARDPSLRQVLSSGQAVPGACPNQPATGRFLDRWLDVALDAGAAAVLWDEPHLWIPDWDDWDTAPTGAWTCRCEACLEAWRASRGGTMPVERTAEVQAFRVDSLLGLLAGAMERARSAGARNILTALPVASDAMEALDWERLAGLPGLDGLGTDPYWFLHDRTVAPYVGDWSRRIREACATGGLRSHIWLAAFGVEPGRAAELEQAVDLVADAGIDELLVWSFPGGSAEAPAALPETEAWARVAAATARRGASIAPTGPGPRW